MLALEQYLVIYFLLIFLCPLRDFKILSGFAFLSILVGATIFDFVNYTPIEFIWFSYGFDLTIFLLCIHFVSDIRIKFIFSCFYLLTMMNPFFLLSLDYMLLRDDFVVFLLYQVCKVSSYIINEVLIALVFTFVKERDAKFLYLTWFIILNYLFILF